MATMVIGPRVASFCAKRVSGLASLRRWRGALHLGAAVSAWAENGIPRLAMSAAAAIGFIARQARSMACTASFLHPDYHPPSVCGSLHLASIYHEIGQC